MPLILNNAKHPFIAPHGVAVIFRDAENNCHWIETTHQEQHDIARKLASHRGWRPEHYTAQPVTMLPTALADRIGRLLTSVANDPDGLVLFDEGANQKEAKAVLAAMQSGEATDDPGDSQNSGPVSV